LSLMMMPFISPLSLSPSRLGAVMQVSSSGWQWSAFNGVVRFHPASLSLYLSISGLLSPCLPFLTLSPSPLSPLLLSSFPLVFSLPLFPHSLAFARA
jgi:hypothetical protein